MKLYKAEVTVTVMFLAESDNQAVIEAEGFAAKELSWNGINEITGGDTVLVQEVTKHDEIPRAWLDSIPWSPRESDERTCRQHLHETTP